MVMYAGRKVEEAPVAELFRTPRHPYTQGLLGAVPKLGSSLTGTATRLAEIPGLVPSLKQRIEGCVFASRCAFATDLCRQVAPALEAKAQRHFAACHYAPKDGGGGMSALLEVNDLKKHFLVRGGCWAWAPAWVHAVDGVSFHVDRGETLALVGESGCGKSTVGRAILRLFDITAGQVVLDGQRIDDLSPGALRPLRRRVQVVFQDPFSSLNPRMRVRDILAEPMRNFGLAASTSRHGCAHRRAHGQGAAAARRRRTAGRTSFPAANASASGSPGRSPPSPTSSCATRRSPRSTSR